MNIETKLKLLEIHHVMDSVVLGDSDPNHIETDQELKEEYPLFWVAKEIALLVYGEAK